MHYIHRCPFQRATTQFTLGSTIIRGLYRKTKCNFMGPIYTFILLCLKIAKHRSILNLSQQSYEEIYNVKQAI